MHKTTSWKFAAAALGISLSMATPAIAQNAGGAGPAATDREARQDNAAVGAARAGGQSGAAAQSEQSGATRQPAAAGRNPSGQTGRTQVQPGQQGQARQQGQAAQQRTSLRPVAGESQSADQQIAALLAIGNQEEIALSRLALEQAQNPKVKEFAQMMIDEHTQVLQQLTQLAPEAAQQAQLKGQEQPAKRSGDEGSAQPAVGGRNFDIVQVRKQIAEECLSTAQREFSEKQGAEFDMCYMGQQLVLHQQMIVKQKVFSQYASGELRQAIDDSTKGAQKHLDHAKKLVRELSPQAASEVSERRTGGDAERSSTNRSGSGQSNRAGGASGEGSSKSGSGSAGGTSSGSQQSGGQSGRTGGEAGR